MVKEIESKKELYREYSKEGSATTLYIGGGTPSVLAPHQLEKIMSALQKNLGLSEIREFTIEVNPDDITPDYARFLHDMGINRVSMGVQSFNDRVLEWMNRRHTAKIATEAFETLRRTGFNNISLDLIFGYAMLSEEMWRYNLENITALSPEHISAYQMSIESGSTLSAMEKRGEYTPPSQERCAAEYSMLQEILSKKGYAQYEVSNFCKRSGEDTLSKVLPYEEGLKYRSIHNSSYWNNVPYIGFAPGAHSYSGIYTNENGNPEAKREWNTHKINRYISYYTRAELTKEAKSTGDRVGNGAGYKAGYEILERRELFNEVIMLGLRQTKGCKEEHLKAIGEHYYREIESTLSQLIGTGMLIKENGYIKIPSEKLFVSDGIIRDLFV